MSNCVQGVTIVVRKTVVDLVEDKTQVSVSESPTLLSVLDNEKNKVVEVKTATTTLEITVPGVQGPKGDPGVQGERGEKGDQGDPGAPGNAAQSFIHYQTSPSDTWVINHNLGFNPICQVFSPGSREIVVDIVHTTLNQTVINLTSPNTGFARLI